MTDVQKYKKDFNGWIEKKKQSHYKIKTPPLFKERDIWWVSVGVNVGFDVFIIDTKVTQQGGTLWQGEYIEHIDCWAKTLAPDKILVDYGVV